MTQPEYEKLNQQCWEKFQSVDNPRAQRQWFNFAFDRAYALGKQTETITQGQIEKAAEKFADEIRVPSTVGALVPMLYDIAKSSYMQGAQDFIGKKEKDANTVISGWVARDDGERWHERELHLFTRNKPERRKLMGDWMGRPSMTLDSNLFPDLTWSDDPIRVEITIKRKRENL